MNAFTNKKKNYKEIIIEDLQLIVNYFQKELDNAKKAKETEQRNICSLVFFPSQSIQNFIEKVSRYNETVDTEIILGHTQKKNSIN